MHKFSITLFIFSVLLFSGGLFSQDEETAAAEATLKESGLDKNKIQQLFIDLEKYNPEDKELFDKMRAGELDPIQTKDLMTRAFTNLPEDVSKKYSGGAGGLGALGPKMLEQVDGALAQFRKMPYDTAFNLVKTKIDSSKFAAAFQKIPKIYTVITNFLRDEEAPKKLFSIIEDKKKLLIYFVINVCIFITSFIVKRKRKKKNEKNKVSFAGSFVGGFNHFVIFTCLKLSVIYVFFGENLGPTFRLIKNTYS